MKNLLHAARPILIDSLGIILFAGLLALHANLIVATAIGASTAVGVVLWHLLTGRQVGALQWMSLALVAISAGATFWFNDPRFVMAKPTVIYTVVGVVMLRRGWMHRYIPEAAMPAVLNSGSTDLLTVFGYVWSGLMFLTAAANLVVAVAFTAWWPAFIGVFPLASKITLFLIQFRVMRTMVRGRLAALRVEGAGT